MKRIIGLLLAIAVAGGSAVASQAGNGGGHDGNGYTVVMSGLDNPRGLTFAGLGEDGRWGEVSRGGSALYVAEAGKGGTLRCTPLRGTVCVGLTGAVSRYWRGHQERIVEGLPSYAPFVPAPTRVQSVRSDVSFADGRGYVSIGLAANPDLRAALGEKFGWIAQFDSTGKGDLRGRRVGVREAGQSRPGPGREQPVRSAGGSGKAHRRRRGGQHAAAGVLLGEHLDACRVPLSLSVLGRQGDGLGPQLGRDRPRRCLLRGRADGCPVHPG